MLPIEKVIWEHFLNKRDDMKLKDAAGSRLIEEGLLTLLKAFFKDTAEDVSTYKDLERLMKEPMPGNEERTKGDHFNDMMKKKGYKF